MSAGLIFRQLFESKSSTYSYLLACEVTKQAVLIDPVIETVDRDAGIVKQLGLVLKFAINTHVHADHVTGSGKLKSLIPGCQSVIAEASQAKANVRVKHGDKSTLASCNWRPARRPATRTAASPTCCTATEWRSQATRCSFAAAVEPTSSRARQSAYTSPCTRRYSACLTTTSSILLTTTLARLSPQ
ncbi:hypothetical protein BOX15_Mlig003730g2 [Macrostomum lignano]|uniref:Metallo-beta-lactamase domain-containing protein n=1 Tax=Macrostomum lignano TaxID=282301 RepID=A0A267FKF2_9PLAT|nr:hypothetical protein BOX15_Mlig003730g2 [Macrostomum lignano]